jgi:hypothetical protein
MPFYSQLPSPFHPCPHISPPSPSGEFNSSILCPLCDHSTEIPSGVATSGTLPWTSIATVTCISAWPDLQSNGIRPSVDGEPNPGVLLHPSTSHARRTSFLSVHGIVATANTSHAPHHPSPSPSRDVAPKAHSCAGILCHKLGLCLQKVHGPQRSVEQQPMQTSGHSNPGQIANVGGVLCQPGGGKRK